MTPDQDIAIRLSGYPVRYQAIDDIERWYFGSQYEVGAYARSHQWDEERDGNRYIPLKDRAPYDLGIAKSLVDRSTAFLFDEERFPRIEVEGDEVAEAWLQELAKTIALRTELLEAARIGGRARSVFVYFKLVDGSPILDTFSGKLCSPRFKSDGKTLEFVRQQYKVTGDELRGRGYTGLDPDADYWYRKDFTEQGEIAYLPVEIKAGAVVPDFKVDAARSFTHNLGFVPGVWMVNLVRHNGFDGVATYESAIKLMHRCNVLLSQADRAIGFACDPQYVLEVDPNEDVDVSSVTTQTKGGIWAMPGKASLIEMTGNGQTIALAQLEAYLKLIGDNTSVPQTDSASMAAKAQSAEALRILNQSIISFAGILRTCYGEQGIAPLAVLILRVLKMQGGKELKFQALDADGKVLDVSAIQDNPRITLKWGPWFAPSSLDRSNEVTATGNAVSMGLLSQETGSGFIASLYDAEGDDEFARIQAEQQVKADEAMRQAADMHALTSEPPPTDAAA